ncbi:MAG: DUF1573 domain-containing protein [Patescibacteria group bacterium]
MKTKTIISTIIVILFILGIYVWGYSTKGGTVGSVQGIPKSNLSKDSLVATETFYDFGAISMKNGEVIKEFTVTNSNDGDIILSKVLTSCMCTNAYIVKSDGNTKGPFGMAGHGAVPSADEIIKAGESRIIRVVFDPNAHGPAGVGKIDRFITLTDTSGNTLQLEIKALVTP